MRRNFAWWLRIAVPTVAVAALGVGLIGSGALSKKADLRTIVDGGPAVGAPGVKLVSFTSCAPALERLRTATLPLVTPYGLGGIYPMVEDSGGIVPPGAPKAAAPDSGAAASANGPVQQAPAEHSTTNNHEAGVDEPDVVKTDGKRLLSVVDGRLRVLDVASHKQTATIDLPSGPATQLLISGDRALVLASGMETFAPEPVANGAQLVLVDLVAAKVIGTLSIEGGYLDARQVGSVARVVVRSAPHLNFVHPDGVRSPDEALFRNRELVGSSPISAWLPRYSLEQNGKHDSGQLVDCQDVRSPESYTGTSMLTVLTLDLAHDLGKGDPVSIAADGDTVYGTGSSLYIADDRTQHVITGFAPMPGGSKMSPLPSQRTSIYQFDISAPGKPTFVASGGVDGTLLNQYSLSEYGNNLRVATTGQQDANLCCDQPGKTESMITVLTRKGDTLAEIGKVGGLGVGERIYAVRFIGPVGYVVTFRQTDPLYTVDLSDPAKPRVAGELKITGYSAYLHPAGDGKLIGVGQDATEQGRRTGLQVSLFDTGSLSSAHRIAQFQLTGGQSEVDFDPHAFLYWADKGLIVVPVMPQWQGRPGTQSTGGALVLKVDGGTLTQVGTITHPLGQNGYPDGSVRRSVVIGDELWTVSQGGAMVNALDGLAQRAWIPFTN